MVESHSGCEVGQGLQRGEAGSEVAADFSAPEGRHVGADADEVTHQRAVPWRINNVTDLQHAQSATVEPASMPR